MTSRLPVFPDGPVSQLRTILFLNDEWKSHMSDDLSNLPLRDVCKEAERLTRELVDHLENNLIPRTRELHELVKPDSAFDTSEGSVKDVTVRNQAANLLESQEFTEQLFVKTRQYFETIDQSVGNMFSQT